MSEEITGLEHKCEKLLENYEKKLSGQMDYGLKDWFERLKLYEQVEDLNAQLAKDAVKYPTRLIIKLEKASKLRGIYNTPRSFNHLRLLRIKLNKLLKYYPNVVNASKRLAKKI